MKFDLNSNTDFCEGTREHYFPSTYTSALVLCTAFPLPCLVSTNCIKKNGFSISSFSIFLVCAFQFLCMF